MAKIGIYAGTFDPIHLGHTSFAAEARSRLGLEKVIFIVEPEPRGKITQASVDQRKQMVRLAIADQPGFTLDETVGESQFSVADTLPRLHAQYGSDLYLLVGTDVFAGITRWPGYEVLARAFHVVVGIRGAADAHDDAALENVFNGVPDAKLPVSIIHQLPDAASTQVRQEFISKIATLDPAVAAFAKLNKIY